MNYFQAKSDLNFIVDFHDNVLALWERENTATKSNESEHSWMAANTPHQIQAHAQRLASSQSAEYQSVRKTVAQGVSRAKSLAALHGVPAIFVSYPAPAVGGAVIKISMFEAILSDYSHGGIKQQEIYDILNRVVGACQEEKDRSWRELINPFFLLKNVALLILRFPFMAIEATGFNVLKFEDHFFGKLFKLLMLLGFAWGLIELGFEKADLVEILKSLGVANR